MLNVFRNSYVLFSMLVVIIITCISILIAIMTYLTVIEDTQLELKLGAQRIEHSLSSFFDEIQSLMFYVAKRISTDDSKDNQVIWEHMKGVLSRSKHPREQGEWPSFAWLDSHDQCWVESKYGIVTVSFDFSIRNYVKMSRKTPWVLHFVDPPTTDIPANNLSLLGGLGLTDQQGNYLGTLNVGFDLGKLTHRVNQILANADIEFVVSDKEWVLMWTAEESEQMKHYFQPLVERAQLMRKDAELLQGRPPLMMAYAINVSEYPFTVVTYIQRTMFLKKYYQALFPHLLEVIGMGFICLLLLHFFWNRVRKKNLELKGTKRKLEHAISLAKASDDAKKEFLRCANNELMVPLNGMIKNVDILLKNLKNEIDVELVVEKQIALLDGILEHALDFKNLTNDTLNLREVNLKSVVDECVIILSKAAFDKSITFEVNIDTDLPKLKADPIKIKQIFVGLFTRAIRYSSQNQKIIVTANKQTNENNSFVEVTIEDKGFGLSEEMIATLEQNLDSLHERDYMEMDFFAMERLMKLHHGLFTVSSQPGKGTVVCLFFPLFYPNLINIEGGGEKESNFFPFSD